MSTAVLQTISSDFNKVRSVNQTSNGYVAKIPTATEPAGDAATATGASIQEMRGVVFAGSGVQNAVILMPYGTGSNNSTFSMRVYGWRPIGLNTPTTALWIPALLCEVACTMTSTGPGIAGKIIVATELFVDTITITYGNANVSVEAVSPANDLPAHIVVDLKGFPKFEATFTTGGSATDCNALWAPM